MKKSIYSLIIACVLGGFFQSCSDDKLGDSIFNTNEQELDPNAYTYPLDCFLQKNYLEPYNLKFQYKMEDISADMEYNLVPCEYEKAIDMAVLAKYLWFDVYKNIVSEEFLKSYSPRIIHLIGSPAINPNSGTEEAGLAEGGLKITLYKVNQLDVNNPVSLNRVYFETMHHEFTHILHQLKNYPVDFNLISVGSYDPLGWQQQNDSIVLSKGFITPYACKENQEDFAETIANYIVLSPEDWNARLDIATYEWETVPKTNYRDIDFDTEYIIDRKYDVTGKVVEYTVLRKIMERDENGNLVIKKDEETGEPMYDENGKPIYIYIRNTDGIDGKSVLEKKLELCRTWLKDSWGIDLDAIRDEVQKRQANMDINALRNEVYQYAK